MAKVTNDGKKGGVLKGKPHYDENGKPLGGIKAVVADTGQEVELEGGEVIINKEAAEKHWPTLSKINQSAGDGVPILPPNKTVGWRHKKKLGGELAIGVKAEKEHAKTIKKVYDHKIKPKDAPKAIAKDHLKEDKKYYTKLDKMENQMAHGGNVDKKETTFNGITYTLGDMGNYGVAKIRSVIITRITATDWIYFTDEQTGKVDRDPVTRFATKYKFKAIGPAQTTQTTTQKPLKPISPSVKTKIPDRRFRVKTEDEFIREFGGNWRRGGSPAFESTGKMDSLLGVELDPAQANLILMGNTSHVSLPGPDGILKPYSIAKWMVTEVSQEPKGHGTGITPKGTQYEDGDQFKTQSTGDVLYTINGITKKEVNYTSSNGDIGTRAIKDFNRAIDGGVWYLVNKLTKYNPPKKAQPTKQTPIKQAEPEKKAEPINYVSILENWVKQNLTQAEELTPEKILKQSVATLSLAIENTDKESTKKLDEALQSISK